MQCIYLRRAKGVSHQAALSLLVTTQWQLASGGVQDLQNVPTADRYSVSCSSHSAYACRAAVVVFTPLNTVATPQLVLLCFSIAVAAIAVLASEAAILASDNCLPQQ